MQTSTPQVSWPGVLALAAGIVALGLLVPPDYLTRANLVWIAIISAAALNLLKGYAGQVSLGHAAFMAIGAYSAVLSNYLTGWGLLAALPFGALMAGFVGLAIGVPSLRLRGFYLALTTLALQFAVTFAANKVQARYSMAGFKLADAKIGPLAITGDVMWYFLLAFICVVTLLAIRNMGRTKVGRAWAAIRDRDIAASIIGVDVTRYKLMAFFISSTIAGMAGVLQAFYIGNVSVETFTIDLTISYIAMVIIGGLGSVTGSILGAIVVTQLPLVIQSAVQLFTPANAIGTNFEIFDIQVAAFGLIIIGFLMFEPDGLVGIGKRIASRWSRRHRGDRAVEQAT